MHRLIQNKGDGKLVEVDEGGNVMQNEKVDSIQLEVSLKRVMNKYGAWKIRYMNKWGPQPTQ